MFLCLYYKRTGLVKICMANIDQVTTGKSSGHATAFESEAQFIKPYLRHVDSKECGVWGSDVLHNAVYQVQSIQLVSWSALHARYPGL
jgi:hypothetical protein